MPIASGTPALSSAGAVPLQASLPFFRFLNAGGLRIYNVTLDALIDEIVPQAEAASRSFLVKVRLPRSEDMFEGMFGRLKIPAGTRRFLCLSTDAIERVGQLEMVDVVHDEVVAVAGHLGGPVPEHLVHERMVRHFTLTLNVFETGQLVGKNERHEIFGIIGPANSGIWFRMPPDKYGYQFDILDYPEAKTGSIWVNGFKTKVTDEKYLKKKGVGAGSE